MYRTATMSAYDMLDHVFVTASVSRYEADGAGFERGTFTASVQVRGVGEDSDSRWLRDALIALAETL